jgi:tRNA (pseudouridine54-N1)-methyltransferase
VREEAIGHIPVETSPGVSLSRMGFEATIETATQKAETVVMLHEEGDPAVDVDPPIDPVFVLSDHHDFTDAEADFLDDVADRRLSLGPKAIHADHAIAVAHNFLDTDGYTTY